MRALYLIILLVSLSYPLYKSWDVRVNYFQKWKHFFKANLLLLIIMLPWDIYFTARGFWGFNPDYYLGFSIAYLPIEEWLFFIIIPFSSLFIYEVIIYFDKKNVFLKYGKRINLVVLLFSLSALTVGFGNWYTTVTMALLATILAYHQFANSQHFLGRFYLSFLFILIPFILINGILTGSFIENEVVWYNMHETLGIRIFTIPLEDFFYCLFFMLFLVTFYERFKAKDPNLA